MWRRRARPVDDEARRLAAAAVEKIKRATRTRRFFRAPQRALYKLPYRINHKERRSLLFLYLVQVTPPDNQKIDLLLQVYFFIHCESNGISSTRLCRVVSHQSVRTVYHHTFRCVSKPFRNGDIQDFVLMICNSLRNW